MSALVPRIGYLASAWGHFACYFTMMVLSFFLGRKYYRINYPLKDILIYVIIALTLFFGSKYSGTQGIIKHVMNMLLILGFILYALIKEKFHLRFFKRKRSR